MSSPARVNGPPRDRKTKSCKKGGEEIESPSGVSPSGDCLEEAWDSIIEVRIPSDTEFVRVVRLAVSGVASLMPFTYEEIEDLKLAVSEACSNAILHAHEGNGGEQVVVQLAMQADRLSISVQDRGAGIPLEHRRKASRPPSELSEQGLGLFLIQALMDEVHYDTAKDTGTNVRMVKYLSGEADSTPEGCLDSPERAESE
ncbi:MAG: ATP-binding protein [Armatimonadetes bacterium]|nr:ATP-binding protein [Armatimonadota bacterium]